VVQVQPSCLETSPEALRGSFRGSGPVIRWYGIPHLAQFGHYEKRLNLPAVHSTWKMEKAVVLGYSWFPSKGEMEHAVAKDWIEESFGKMTLQGIEILLLAEMAQGGLVRTSPTKLRPIRKPSRVKPKSPTAPPKGTAKGGVRKIPSQTGGANGNMAEQGRNALGQFVKKGHPGQGIPGASAVDDFVAQARRNGFDVVGRNVTVNTPYGQRIYDLALRNRQTRVVTGVEIKSSKAAMARFDKAARQQFAADRWLNTRGGATAVGKLKDTKINDTIKILWEIK